MNLCTMQVSSVIIRNLFRRTRITSFRYFGYRNGFSFAHPSEKANLWRLWKRASIVYDCTVKRFSVSQFSCVFLSQVYKDAGTTEGSRKTIGLADEIMSTRIRGGDSEKRDPLKEINLDEETEKEKAERQKRALKFTFYAFGIMMTGLAGSLLFLWGSPQKDDNGIAIIDEFSELPFLQQYVYRMIKEARNMNKMIKEPARDALLPDLPKDYPIPPFTLLLELRDILVHPEWTYETGWRFKKRPGVDFLLHHLSPYYEIVIYTSEVAFTALPILEQLNANGLIHYGLFRDSTYYVDGKHLKELNRLNRNLNKVIMVDWDSEAITTPRNQLRLKKWDGSMNDQTLVDLAIMLRTVAESDVSDVRDVLDYYRTCDDPVRTFKEKHMAALEQEQKLRKKVQEEAVQKGLTSSYATSFLRRR